MENCPICFNIINENTTTNCGHSFCNSCIEEWFNKGNSECPMCRQRVSYFMLNGEKFKTFFNNNENDTNNNGINARLYLHNKKLKVINCLLWIVVFYELINNIMKSFTINDQSETINIYEKNLTECNNELYLKNENIVEIKAYNPIMHMLQSCYVPFYYINKCLGNT